MVDGRWKMLEVREMKKFGESFGRDGVMMNFRRE
jgi:hypothetical protein